VNEKIELFEEIVVDLRTDLRKAREITTHFYRTIEKLKENYSKKHCKKSELNFLNYLLILKLARETLQTPSLKKRKRSMN